MLHLIARVAVAATLAAAAYAALPAGPAVAAACPTDDGVTVVVDFHELGGGVVSACVAGGGGDRASELFPAAGFGLDYVQRQPGFVCRVSGKPADNPCVSTPPANAYWSLWWSDGASGSWTYATTGASGLTVPDGGYVGFSWQGSSSRTAPGVAPAPRPDPTPSQQPTAEPSQAPTKQPSTPTTEPGGQSTAPSVAPSGSASPSAPVESGAPRASKRPKPGGATASASASASASPSPSETDDAVVATSAEPADPADDGLPTWVAPVAVLVLFGAAGGVAVVRRRRPGSGTP